MIAAVALSMRPHRDQEEADICGRLEARCCMNKHMLSNRGLGVRDGLLPPDRSIDHPVISAHMRYLEPMVAPPILPVMRYLISCRGSRSANRMPVPGRREVRWSGGGCVDMRGFPRRSMSDHPDSGSGEHIARYGQVFSTAQGLLLGVPDGQCKMRPCGVRLG